MKLLFEEATFSETLKELIGHVDADIPFITLKPDLRSATTEMIKIIGSPMYDYVSSLSENITLGTKDQELLHAVQYPIALNAFRMWLPTSDLQHTVNGRFMRSDEHEKSPFEWMIERDDKVQEKKYYRAVDDMLNYLESENPNSWKTSEAYQKQKQYFVNSTDVFDSYFPINSRLLFIKLLPGIRKAEDDYVLPIMGASSFESLKSDFESNTIGVEDQKRLRLIQEACVYYALSWAMQRLSATLFPEGVLQRYVSSKMLQPKKTPGKMESQLAHQEFEKDAQVIFKRLQDTIPKPTPKPNNQSNDEPIKYDFGFDENDKFASF